MKKRIVCLMMCVLIACASPALAEPLTPEAALKLISNHLTEVYSYTAEEAGQFDVAVEWEEDRWRIRFSPAGHPEWVYSGEYQDGGHRVENVETPFLDAAHPQEYPGEGSVREGLRRAREKGWFQIWEDHMRAELAGYMNTFGITPTARLAEGLSTGKLAPGDALHEYFVSCYGHEMDWTPALKQWHDEELVYYSFSLTQEEPLAAGVRSWKTAASNGIEVEMTHFVDEVPAQFTGVFGRLEQDGWRCLCGAASQNVGNRYGYALAAFEKGDERLLAGLKFDMEKDEWTIFPISCKALYTDKKMDILLKDAKEKNGFVIVYENSDSETESFTVKVGTGMNGEMDAYIQSYARMNEASGSGFKLEFSSVVNASVYENHQKISEETGVPNISASMAMMDISAFPTTLEAWKNVSQEVIPQGYALVRGVHLRQKTSSRSKDLGEYNSGVLVKVLGTEPGDPWPWYHVRVGRAEGYMASHYVDEAVTQDTGYVLGRGLPIAQAQKEIELKQSPGWLNRTVQRIPEGTRMHVLADCDGGWLHVSIPQGEMGWTMDPNGMDGYVREKDVLVGATPLALDWME